jgi:hypothetical protein
MIKISKTHKLDNIHSWSLPAGSTCPGSRNRDGSLVPVCQGCYAKSGHYCCSSVKNVREHNRRDWKRARWVDDMVAFLDNERYFRWFDSGDVYCVGLANKMLEVMERTPWVHHWLPTHSHKVAKIDAVLRRMEKLPNVMVRRSSDDVNGSHVKGLHGSTVVASDDQLTDGVRLCEAYSNKGGKCGGCRACWDKSVPVVAYLAHGIMMKGVIKRLAA